MSASSFHSKKDGLAECVTTQLDLFDHRVCDHAVVAGLLCSHHAPKARCMMQTERKPTYPQNWPAYNQAQTNEKAKFQELLFELCQNVEDLPRKPGAGRHRLPLGEMIYCAAFKIYSTVSGRRFISDLREAQRRGFITKTPHFNTIFNYLELEEMTDILKSLITQSSLPLKSVEHDFAVDSSGFSTGRFERWFNVKYGNTEDWRDWIKVHLMCGVKTNVVTSVEISGRFGADSPFFKPLFETTARHFDVKEVSADKAYSSRANLTLVVNNAAKPFIPYTSKANPDGRHAKSQAHNDVWKRMYHFYELNREYFKAHYHKRSNVETTFSMIKAKFGERLKSRTETARVNELLCKVLCHNLCCVIQSIYELGVEVNFCAESTPAQNLDA
jgi:transposase